MSSQRGSAFLLKIDGSDGYETVAGLRTSQMTIDNGTVSISAAGIFLSGQSETLIRNHALSGTSDEYELSFEDGSRFRGKFLVQRLDYSGDFNGERNYTIQLESCGVVVSA